MPGATGSASHLRLTKGDTLLLYTDGLVERRGVELEDRLRLLLRTVEQRAGHPTLDGFCQHVISSLAPGVHRLHDDIALLALERLQGFH